DEMIVKDFLQRLQGIPRLLFERLIAAPGKRFIVIRRPVLPALSDSGSRHIRVVNTGLATAFQLTADGFRLVDKQNHDVDRRMPEMDTQWSVVELTPQFVHLVDEQLQALHLDL